MIDDDENDLMQKMKECGKSEVEKKNEIFIITGMFVENRR